MDLGETGCGRYKLYGSSAICGAHDVTMIHFRLYQQKCIS